MKRDNKYTTDRFCLRVEHAQATADTTIAVLKASRKMRVDRVRYHNATGLATDPDNFFNLQVLKGAAVVANWSTDTGEEEDIAADTWIDLVMGAAADQVLDAGDELDIVLDETGTATLPAGTFFIEGRYL